MPAKAAPAVLLLTCLFLLAGCSSPAPAEDASTSSADESDTVAPAPPTPVVAAPVPISASCTLTRTNLGTTTGYGLNIDRAVTGFDECALQDYFDGNTTWAQAALVEAVWTNQASQTGTDLWIESDACQPTLPPATCVPPSTMGAASPLRLELSTDELRAVEDRNALVMASGQGVVVDLEYTLYVTLFPDGVIPAGYTAIP